MGKVINGNPMMFTGTVGDYVGSMWNGIYVVRKKPGPRTTEPTALQLAQQARFAMMIKFFWPLNDLLMQTYKRYAVRMTGFNKAFSANSRRILTGAYPSFGIDYSKVTLSRGWLPNVGEPVAASTLSGQLEFNWIRNCNVARTLPSDHAFVAAYCPDLDQWIYKENIAPRNAGGCTLDITPFSGKLVQTYIGCFSTEENMFSDSLYTGAVNVL